MSQYNQNNQNEENRYQLVNHVAKRAKVLIHHDPAAQMSNHSAISQALTQKDEPQQPHSQVRP